MKECWSEHASNRPSFQEIIERMETVMASDSPYLDIIEAEAIESINMDNMPLDE